MCHRLNLDQVFPQKLGFGKEDHGTNSYPNGFKFQSVVTDCFYYLFWSSAIHLGTVAKVNG